MQDLSCQSLNSSQYGLTKKDRNFFSPQEDASLRQLVKSYGARNWILLASMIPGKTSRQCRDRYMNYLAPGLNHLDWTPEEDELLKKLVDEMGPKWAQIAKRLPHRSPISIKNRWAHFLGKRFKNSNNHIIDNLIVNSHNNSQISDMMCSTSSSNSDNESLAFNKANLGSISNGEKNSAIKNIELQANEAEKMAEKISTQCQLGLNIYKIQYLCI